VRSETSLSHWLHWIFVHGWPDLFLTRLTWHSWHYLHIPRHEENEKWHEEERTRTNNLTKQRKRGREKGKEKGDCLLECHKRDCLRRHWQCLEMLSNGSKDFQLWSLIHNSEPTKKERRNENENIRDKKTRKKEKKERPLESERSSVWRSWKRRWLQWDQVRQRSQSATVWHLSCPLSPPLLLPSHFLSLLFLFHKNFEWRQQKQEWRQQNKNDVIKTRMTSSKIKKIYRKFG